MEKKKEQDKAKRKNMKTRKNPNWMRRRRGMNP
jgi:hypothetical protein